MLWTREKMERKRTKMKMKRIQETTAHASEKMRAKKKTERKEKSRERGADWPNTTPPAEGETGEDRPCIEDNDCPRIGDDEEEEDGGLFRA
jgi:hypothetical protein